MLVSSQIYACILAISPVESSGERKSEAPKSRPKLNLQPRSKPLEEAGQVVASANPSIFGGAKPVDTATREREIEERLLCRLRHEKENR